MTSRILLADDSITIQKVVNLTFADEGIEVVAVSNGELAERRLSDIKPDLVLADIFMPGKNGYELCEFVKQDPQFRNVPVVLLVGAFEPFNEAEARRVRADAHLTKPFESRTLVETVRQLISKSAKPSTGSLTTSQPRLEEPEVPLTPVYQAPSVPSSFDLDLEAMAQEWPVPQTPGAGSTDFSEGPVTASLNESPLELEYGSFSSSELAPSGFQMETESGSVDVNSVDPGSTLKDTAELSLDDAQPQAVLGDTSWAEVNAHPPTQSSFADSGVPVGGSDAFGTYDSEPESQGFRVKSTFEGRSSDSVQDFDQLDTLTASDDVVSFDVDFSVPASPEQAVNIPEAPQPETVDLTPNASEVAPESPSLVVTDEPTDDVSVHVAQTAILGSLEDPLGDVFAISTEAATHETVSTAFDIAAAGTDPTEPLAVDDLSVTDTASQLTSEPELLSVPTTDFQLPQVGEEVSEPPEEIQPATYHSGASFEAFVPAPTEPIQPETPLPLASEPEAVAEQTAGEAAATEPIAEHASEPSVRPSEEPPWSEEDTRFAPIDIEAVVVNERHPGEFAGQMESETGFDFAAVADEALEEATIAPQAIDESVSSSSTPAFAEAVAAGEGPQQVSAIDLSAATIDEIVRRVVAQLSDSVIREIAWDIVPDCVERVITKLTEEAVSRKA